MVVKMLAIAPTPQQKVRMQTILEHFPRTMWIDIIDAGLGAYETLVDLDKDADKWEVRR